MKSNLRAGLMCDSVLPVPEADSSVKCIDKFQLGVLLVHGIGKQPSGETLVSWGDALLDVIHRGTRGKVKPTVEWGRIDGAVGERAEAVIQLPFGDKTESWLLTEGWWAESFPPPSYRELVSWSLRALPWAVCVHVAERYRQTISNKSKWWTKTASLITAVGRLLIALALTPVFIFFLATALLLGMLPIPQLRTLILSVQSVLTATVGDSLIFVESPIRATFLRTRILDGLKLLEERGCKRTLIIAHSQGAAAVHEALYGIVKSNLKGESTVELNPPVPRPVPDALLSFGAGIKKLASLNALSTTGLKKKLGVNPAYGALGAFVAATVLLAIMYLGVQAQRISIFHIRDTALLWLLTSVVLGLLLLGGSRLIRVLADRIPALTNRVKNLLIGTLTTLLLSVLVGVIAYAKFVGLPYETVSSFGLAVIMLGLSTSMILSHQIEKIIKAPIRKPPRLARWIDFYASSDPVPNGPTRTGQEKEEQLESTQIWNQGSFLADHTTYWDNLDGFVVRVARACAETAESPWVGALPPETSSVDERAKWRVSFLRLTRWITGPAWITIFLLLWWQYGARIPLTFDPPGWLPSVVATTTRFSLLVALIGLFAWIVSGSLRLIWRRWVREEQKAVLNHEIPEKTWQFWLFGMMMVSMVIVSLAIVLPSIEADTLKEILDDPTQLIDLLVMPFGFAIFLTMLLAWRQPPPEWRDQSYRPSDIHTETKHDNNGLR